MNATSTYLTPSPRKRAAAATPTRLTPSRPAGAPAGGSPPPRRSPGRRPTDTCPRGEAARDDTDLLHLLARAHREYDHACRAQLRAVTFDRVDLDRFALDLLAHEALKQVLLHPMVARLPWGRELVAERRAEQELLGHVLLRVLNVADERDRLGLLAQFHQHLIEHMDREELEIFPHLRHVVDSRQLDRLGAIYAVVHPVIADQPTTFLHPSGAASPSSSQLLPRLCEIAGQELTCRGIPLPS